MIGNDKDRCVFGKLLDYPAGHGVESFVHPTHCISKTGLCFRIVKKMTAIHVLPEVMLDCIYRHENEHHYVLGMVLQKVKSDCCPLLVDPFHFSQHLSASVVRRHIPEEAKIMINLSQMINQLAFQRRRIAELTSCRWRIQTGNLEAVQSLRWIGKRNVHRAHRESGGIEYLPDGRRTT